MARLVGAVESAEFAAGSLIFAEGANADALYLLEAGRVTVELTGESGARVLTALEAPAYFGELGLLLGRRTATVQAAADVRTYRLPRQRFEHLTREHPAIGFAMAGALAGMVDRRSREHVGAPAAPPVESTVLPEAPALSRPQGSRIAALAIVLGVPLVLWGLPPPAGLSPQGWRVGLILLGAALGWLSEPLPDFVIALAMATAWGLAGLVPPARAFAGFTSSSYLVALGALGLAAAMARSGLLFRIALLLMKTFPATYAGQMLALLAGGVVVTPLMPLGIGRVATIAPLTQELAQSLGYAARDRGSAGLAFAGVLGYGAFSSIFLTGLAMNFYVYELFPRPDQLRFGWLPWFAAAIPMGLVLFAGALVMLLVCFRPGERGRASSETLRRQQYVLGPVSRHEAATTLAVAVLLLGLMLQPFLHLDGAWLALSALVIATASGVLDRAAFRSSIEWGFLVLFGVLLGTAGVLQSAGLDRWIAGDLMPVARAVGHPSALIMLLALFVVVCRVVLPWIPATLLLSLVFVPAAPRLGLSPWVVGFVILMAANTWLHPRQSDYCRLMRDATRGEMFTERDGAMVGAGLTALTLLGIAASIPYWRALHLLSP